MEPSTLLKLNRCPLLSMLEEKQLESIFSRIPSNLKHYPSGRLVAFRGDELNRLMLLLEGNLSAEIVSMKGKVLKVETLQAPCIIAGPMLFADEHYLPVQLTAEEDVEILSLSRDAALTLLSSDPRILQQFLRDSGNKVSFLSEKIRLYQFHSIRQKIAVYLLDLYAKQKTQWLRFPLKIETMAELFSVTRPSLSRCLSELVEEGILERDGRQYKICDKETLTEMIQG